MNATIDQSEQGVIAADADALTRMDVGAALTDQDVAGQNELTVAAPDAEALDSESRPFLVEPTPFYVPL